MDVNEQVARLAERVENLEESLREIAAWPDNYPEDLFPSPDMAAVKSALSAAGLSLDAVSAYVARRLLKTIASKAQSTLDAPIT